MTTTLEELYQKIGQEIDDLIPEDWTTAWVMVEIHPEHIYIIGRYKVEESDEQWSFRVSQQILSDFENLHSQMIESSMGDWKKAKFNIERSGKFDMNFEY